MQICVNPPPTCDRMSTLPSPHCPTTCYFPRDMATPTYYSKEYRPFYCRPTVRPSFNLQASPSNCSLSQNCPPNCPPSSLQPSTCTAPSYLPFNRAPSCDSCTSGCPPTHNFCPSCIKPTCNFSSSPGSSCPPRIISWEPSSKPCPSYNQSFEHCSPYKNVFCNTHSQLHKYSCNRCCTCKSVSRSEPSSDTFPQYCDPSSYYAQQFLLSPSCAPNYSSTISCTPNCPSPPYSSSNCLPDYSSSPYCPPDGFSPPYCPPDGSSPSCSPPDGSPSNCPPEDFSSPYCPPPDDSLSPDFPPDDPSSPYCLPNDSLPSCNPPDGSSPSTCPSDSSSSSCSAPDGSSPSHCPQDDSSPPYCPLDDPSLPYCIISWEPSSKPCPSHNQSSELCSPYKIFFCNTHSQLHKHSCNRCCSCKSAHCVSRSEPSSDTFPQYCDPSSYYARQFFLSPSCAPNHSPTISRTPSCPSPSYSSPNCLSDDLSAPYCPTDGSSSPYCPPDDSSSAYSPPNDSSPSCSPPDGSSPSNCPPEDSSSPYCPPDDSLSPDFPPDDSSSPYCLPNDFSPSCSPPDGSSPSTCPLDSSLSPCSAPGGSSPSHCPLDDSSPPYCPPGASSPPDSPPECSSSPCPRPEHFLSSYISPSCSPSSGVLPPCSSPEGLPPNLPSLICQHLRIPINIPCPCSSCTSCSDLSVPRPTSEIGSNTRMHCDQCTSCDTACGPPRYPNSPYDQGYSQNPNIHIIICDPGRNIPSSYDSPAYQNRMFEPVFKPRKKFKKYNPGPCRRPFCKPRNSKEPPCRYKALCMASCFNQPPNLQARYRFVPTIPILIPFVKIPPHISQLKH